MVLALSAFGIFSLFFPKPFIYFRLYWRILCSVLCVFFSIIYLIFLVARYPNVPCFCVYLNALIKCFGSYFIASSNPSFKLFICFRLSFVLLLLVVYGMCFVLYLLWLI